MDSEELLKKIKNGWLMGSLRMQLSMDIKEV
jgi:hypothetical protein